MAEASIAVYGAVIGVAIALANRDEIYSRPISRNRILINI